MRTLEQFQSTPQVTNSILWDANAWNFLGGVAGQCAYGHQIDDARALRPRSARDQLVGSDTSPLVEPEQDAGGHIRKKFPFTVIACTSPLEAILASGSSSDCKMC